MGVRSPTSSNRSVAFTNIPKQLLLNQQAIIAAGASLMQSNSNMPVTEEAGATFSQGVLLKTVPENVVPTP